MIRYIALLAFSFLLTFAQAQRSSGGMKLALLKYSGGGDWYSVVDALQNFSKFCNDNLGTNFDTEYATVDVGSPDIFNYPFLFMTGHGNVVLSNAEAENLRIYLMGGGFLFVDDDYGMEPYFKVAVKKIFPDRELIELPFEHPIYRQKYDFKNGLPKIHEHDGKPPRGYGIFHEGRLVLFFGVESNISDGWESREVHRTPEELRQQALRMGANIVQFAFKQ